MSRSHSKYLTDYKTSEHLSDEQRKALGSFWTPPELATKMAKKLGWKKGDKVLDPTCGGGGLLCAMLDEYPDLQEEDCYGVDIDPKAIKLCIAYIQGGHFQVGDILVDDITDDKFWEKDPLSREWTPSDKRGTKTVSNFRFGL
jgi:type I restriction-modification system DNA methylase subunit